MEATYTKETSSSISCLTEDLVQGLRGLLLLLPKYTWSTDRRRDLRPPTLLPPFCVTVSLLEEAADDAAVVTAAAEAAVLLTRVFILLRFRKRRGRGASL